MNQPWPVGFNYLLQQAVIAFSFSVMSDSFVTPWTLAHQASPSMGFPRKEYWSGLPFLPPGDLPNPYLLHWQADCLPLHHLGNPVIAAQSCLTLCDTMDCSPPGSSVHGILQARLLELVAISFSRGKPRPRHKSRLLLEEIRMAKFEIPTSKLNNSVILENLTSVGQSFLNCKIGSFISKVCCEH